MYFHLGGRENGLRVEAKYLNLRVSGGNLPGIRGDLCATEGANREGKFYTIVKRWAAGGGGHSPGRCRKFCRAEHGRRNLPGERGLLGVFYVNLLLDSPLNLEACSLQPNDSILG